MVYGYIKSGLIITDCVNILSFFFCASNFLLQSFPPFFSADNLYCK